MRNTLPSELLELRQFLPDLVAEARRHVPYACALVTQRNGLQVIKSPGEEIVNPTPPDPGIRISVWDGMTWHSVATNRLDNRDHLLRLTRDLATSVTVKDGPVPDQEPELDRHFSSRCEQDPAMIDARTRQDLCARVYSGIRDRDPRLVMVRAICVTDREYRLFCNGPRLLSADSLRTLLFCVAIAVDDGKQVQNYDYKVGTGWEAISDIDESWLHKVADDTLANLDADRIEPGEYTCVLGPDIAGTLAHESFGHGCEVDTMMRGAARAMFYIGRRVGSDLVNITDFPGLPGRNGSIFFSDDGVVADEPIVLVRNGILQPTMMCDRYSYLMMKDRIPGLKQSASGRLESWSHPVYARMTNTYFEPRPKERGGMTGDEMLASTETGVLLEKLTSGMEDPLGWGVQLQVMRGREIKAGRLTDRRFYQIGVTGYVPDVLASVDAVGTELDLESAGMCGKGHKEWVRTATGGPWIRCRMKLG